MATLTQKQRKSLENVLYHLDRAIRYVQDDSTVICRKSSGTTTLDYRRPDGQCIVSVAKEYGSDLCGLMDARKYLYRFLNPPENAE